MPVRDAQSGDMEQITAMVLEHASHEGAREQCAFDVDRASAAMFGSHSTLHALIAYPAGEPEVSAGFALWYPSFSSWAGTTGIWLEDLFVRPSARRLGLGRELLDELRSRTVGRLEWDVLDSNLDAQAFYGRLGAVSVPGW